MLKLIYSPHCLGYHAQGHPESPERVKSTHALLKKEGFIFIEPQPSREEDILLVHSPSLLSRVKSGEYLDADTPNLPGVIDYVLLSAGAALLAEELALDGERSFSLMRPPGHHASREEAGGFCYFNNMAIAVKKALEKVDKVAILDLDCHHGNGTQDIFWGGKDVLYLSLHQSPLYPGTGLNSGENCINFPLSPGTGEKEYLETLEVALGRMEDFSPSLIGISMGFDTYKGDPLTNMSLEISSYRKIGELLSSLNRPLFILLEGGYSPDLPRCILEFIRGLEGMGL